MSKEGVNLDAVWDKARRDLTGQQRFLSKLNETEDGLRAKESERMLDKLKEFFPRPDATEEEREALLEKTTRIFWSLTKSLMPGGGDRSILKEFPGWSKEEIEIFLYGLDAQTYIEFGVNLGERTDQTTEDLFGHKEKN